MKNSKISKTCIAFIFGLLVVSLGYSTSCGSHGNEGHGTGGHSGEKHGKSAEHSKQKLAPEVEDKTLAGFYGAYLPIQKALAKDNLKTVKQSVKMLGTAAKGINGEKKHEAFLTHLKKSVDGLAGAKDIDAAREHFMHLSYLTITLLQHNKYAGDTKALVYHCPMAADGKGADWLQSIEGTKNPYYGKSMLACGSKTKTIGK